MHLFLTDRLACPRCGPDFGLILLAHEVREHRIIRGDLGCSNCRETYPVEEGFGDLRLPPRSPLPPAALEVAEQDSEATLRVAAALGVAEGPGTLLLRGSVCRHARALSEMIPNVEVVADDPSGRMGEEEPGVSRMVTGAHLPFFDGTFRGVAAAGHQEDRAWVELVRVVAPLGRVVAMEAPGGTRESFREMGLEVLLDERGVLVGRRPPGSPSPLITLRGT